MPLEIVEIGTSFINPSNGFSPILPIRTMVWNSQATTTYTGTANQTKPNKIITYYREIGDQIIAHFRKLWNQSQRK